MGRCMQSYLCAVPPSLKSCNFEVLYPVKNTFFVCFLVYGSSSEIKTLITAAHKVCTMYPSFLIKLENSICQWNWSSKSISQFSFPARPSLKAPLVSAFKVLVPDQRFWECSASFSSIAQVCVLPRSVLIIWSGFWTARSKFTDLCH